MSPASAPIPVLGGKRILLVDDNVINREVAQRMVEKTGAEVVLAENGAQALQQLESEAIDLVLMDLQMPVMDGFEATAQLRAIGHDLPILALSAAVMQDETQRARKAGVNDHLAKPIDREVLYHALGYWLGADAQAPAADTDTDTDADADADAGADATTTAEPPGRLPEQLPGFDLAQGVHYLDGAEDFYLSMLERFHQRIATEFDTLPDLLVAGEWEAARQLAHSLKGLGATLGAVTLHTLAAHIETTLHAGEDVDETQRQALIHALAEAKESLEDLSARQQLEADQTDQDQDQAHDPAAIRYLRDGLADSEFIEEATLQAALAPLQHVAAAGDLETLRKRVEQMEHEAALAHLDNILQQAGIQLP